jgi:hypothetical protein
MITLSFGCQGLVGDNFGGVSGKEENDQKKLEINSLSKVILPAVSIFNNPNNITLLSCGEGVTGCLSETTLHSRRLIHLEQRIWIGFHVFSISCLQ